MLDDVIAADADGATTRLQDSAHDSQERCLASTVWSEQAVDFTRIRVEVYARQRDELTVSQVGICLRKLADLDHDWFWKAGPGASQGC